MLMPVYDLHSSTIAGYIARKVARPAMPSNSQRRAIDAHRRRLVERGIERFEVRGLETDKEMIRGIARRLAAGDDALRADLARRITGGEQPRVGGILEALRRSPLVAADLDLTREETSGRQVEL